MKVLITGAAGFLGRHFADYYTHNGDEVTGVDDLSAAGSYWTKLLDERYETDLGVFLSWATANYDLVYHFAAPVGGRLKIEDDPLFNADSLRLDSLMFRWAVKHTKTLVYPSSSAVYGVLFQDGADSKPLRESDLTLTDYTWPRPDEMYGLTKLTGEVLAANAAKYGLNTLCIRPFSGYGEGQSLDYPVPAILQRAKRREDPLLVWGTGLQSRDFIHVDDLVGATIARLEAGINGYETMNIGTGWARDFLQIAALAASIVGYSPHIRGTEDGKPIGVWRRVADVTEMLRYYEPEITLVDGLRRVLDSI